MQTTVVRRYGIALVLHL